MSSDYEHADVCGPVVKVPRTQAEQAARRLIHAGLRHPLETNPWGMACDIAEALGLIPTVTAHPRRKTLTDDRPARRRREETTTT